MASNNQRAKISRRLWGRLRDLIDVSSSIEIEDDSMGVRYEVNKFGIVIKADSYFELDDLRQRLLGLLKLEGWDIEQSKVSDLVNLTNGSIGDANAVCSLPGHLLNEGRYQMYIGVY